jgi:hypothetical protein
MGRTSPIKLSAEVHLGRVHHQQPATMSCQSGLHVLGPEAGEVISVLDHDRGHGLVTGGVSGAV